jgi:hypothetical protein
MNNARVLFEQIVDKQYVDDKLINKTIEDTWLECKRKTHPDRGNLDEGDKANFAKAISGFANSSGGVLIFGLVAQKGIDGLDLIQAMEPIQGLKLFESELREKESRIIERAVSGIEYKKFYTEESRDEGMLVVFIPESNNPPHRNMIDKHFYLRAGGNFHPMDLPQIESMVLKNIRPELEIDFLVFTDVDIRSSDDKRFHMLFKLTNIGKSIAKNVFVRLKFPKKFWYDIGPLSRKYHRVVTENQEIVFDWYHDEPIHPDICINIEESAIFMRPVIKPPDEYPAPLLFDVSICAENMPLKKITVDIDGRGMFERLLQPNRRVNLLKFQI